MEITNRKAIAFEKSLEELKGKLDEITMREYWQNIVQFAIDAEIIEAEKDAADMKPNKVQFLATKVAEEYEKATTVDWE